nr:sugar ABC transporter ATP-binding protein [Blastococcus saxobsidens]
MDFTLREGEIHALLGENGAGKSTLIKAVAGAIGVDGGSISVGGTEMEMRTPHVARAAGISVVHQHGNLVTDLSILENVLLTEGMYRRAGVLVDWKRSRERVRQVLARVGVERKPDVLVRDLSPHEVALVSLAKALAGDARVVILDEPTAALLPDEVERLFGQMRQLAAEGIGFVYVTHRLGEVFQICDRITVMRDGRLVGSWDRAELDHDALVDHLVGPEKALAEITRATEEIGPPVLEVSGLSAAGLHDVSFDVREREVLGVASLPGEGSEALVEALFGLRRAGGSVLLRGKRLDVGSPRRAVRSGVALVPRDRQAHGLVPDMSVRENATLAATDRFRTDVVTRLMSRRSERQTLASVMKRLQVKTPSLETSISSLSGGNAQKVVIGRWLVRQSDVYLLDSPTAAVDVHAKSEIYALARELASSGAPVIFTSTEVEELVRLCDRVVVLHGGRIVGELTGDDLTVAAILRMSFGSSVDQ